MTRSTLLTFALLVCAGPAAAHQLSVYATVEDGVALIEAAFADGRPVSAGTLRILDVTGALIMEQPLQPPYPIRFAVGEHIDGLRIEVDAGGGHENYWLLTPADIQQ
jgi:nickel transport protein